LRKTLELFNVNPPCVFGRTLLVRPSFFDLWNSSSSFFSCSCWFRDFHYNEKKDSLFGTREPAAKNLFHEFRRQNFQNERLHPDGLQVKTIKI